MRSLFPNNDSQDPCLIQGEAIILLTFQRHINHPIVFCLSRVPWLNSTEFLFQLLQLLLFSGINFNQKWTLTPILPNPIIIRLLHVTQLTKDRALTQGKDRTATSFKIKYYPVLILKLLCSCHFFWISYLPSTPISSILRCGQLFPSDSLPWLKIRIAEEAL